MHHVFVDSNVLGSKTQYDWLFLLRRELHMMFSLSTSDDVLDEAHRVWRRKHPELGGAMRAQREELFRLNFNEISSEWEGAAAPVVDVDDSHVHNAAVHLNAEILLTNNVKDFGDPDTLPYDLYTPDEFFRLIYRNAPEAVRVVASKQVAYWAKRKQLTSSDADPKKLSDALSDAGCPDFAQDVKECLQLMSGMKVTEGQPKVETRAAVALT